jgi:hypothetical protein
MFRLPPQLREAIMSQNEAATDAGSGIYDHLLQIPCAVLAEDDEHVVVAVRLKRRLISEMSPLLHALTNYC